jgi:hypothetical protein
MLAAVLFKAVAMPTWSFGSGIWVVICRWMEQPAQLVLPNSHAILFQYKSLAVTAGTTVQDQIGPDNVYIGAGYVARCETCFLHAISTWLGCGNLPICCPQRHGSMIRYAAVQS